MKQAYLSVVLSAGVCFLAACGGGSSGGATVTTPATGTSITGNVVKGPVNGSQVCAYQVIGTTRGAGLGNCATTDGTGAYVLNLPAFLGDLILEASGGTYTDEVTSVNTSMPSGSVMSSMVTANGGNAVSMVTPFTTMALNAAIASGTLNAGSYQTAITQLISSLSLPSGIDLTTGAPTFGANINSYGTALTNVSRLINNGTTLSSLLSGVATPSLVTAYLAAAAGTVTPPVVTPPVVTPPSTAGAVSATGTLTLTGAGNNFTPASTGFEVEVDGSSVKYKFTRPVTYPNGGTSTAMVEISNVNGANPAVYYFDALVSFSTFYSCTSNCGITFSTPAGATHPVTVTFNNTPLSGGRTLSGSLVGEAVGAVWLPADLPRSTTSQITLAGNAAPVTSASYTVASNLPNASIILSDGSSLTVGNGTVLRLALAGVVTPGFLYQQCATNCGLTMTESATGLTITFANTPLDASTSLNGTVFIGKTYGTVTVGTLGNFAPVSDSIKSINDKKTIVFSVLGTPAQGGISLLTVETRGTSVLSITAVSGIATGLNSCYETAFSFGGIPACAGATVSADGRTVTFANTALSGGVAINGTLTARGQ